MDMYSTIERANGSQPSLRDHTQEFARLLGLA